MRLQHLSAVNWVRFSAHRCFYNFFALFSGKRDRSPCFRAPKLKRCFLCMRWHFATFFRRGNLKNSLVAESCHWHAEEFWMSKLETLARSSKGLISQVDSGRSVSDEQRSYPSVESLGLVTKYSLLCLPVKYTGMSSTAYKFRHASFADFFQARWLARQPEAKIRACFEDNFFGIPKGSTVFVGSRPSLLKTVSTTLVEKNSRPLYVMSWELV